MKDRRVIPADTLAMQARASEPDLSAWVSAHAGSGKTHVLARRVVRLLLNGADPSRILCLTYTKAAAANMSNRVFAQLARWTLLPDAELAAEIAELDGRPPRDGRLGEARRLFARALETPGGLKIQTIHAFCEAILHQFPLEANIAGHFEMLDSRSEAALVGEARATLLSGFVDGARDERAEAFDEILAQGGETGLDQLLSEIVRRRDEIRSFLDGSAGVDGATEALYDGLELDPDETAASAAASAWPLPGFSSAELEELGRVAESSDARRLLDLVAGARHAFSEVDPVARLRLAAAAFLKADGEPYAAKGLFTKAVQAALPDIADRYARAAADLKAALDRIALIRMLEATRAALRLADRLIALYERLKAARGFLDFNDLIEKTLRLLSRPDAGLWVQYRLDQGIDHILVDEAQDTSPGQWAVITQLTEEFFAGRGAREDRRRTVFAVGDEKQSIYSFQGAEPQAFAETRHFFGTRIGAAGGRFESVRLTRSFRSTDDVLAAVDRVFANPANRKGLTRDPEPIAHLGIRSGEPGYVEVWPSIGKASVEEPDDWSEPIDHASAPSVMLAERIAGTVRRWLDAGDRLEGRGTRVSPGDILVLVRKRDRFVHALSRAFKNRGIPVAGADRLDLRAHIAVKDLAAIGRVVLQPADDLSLAALLRSPIFDIPEERLFALAHGRPGRSTLWQALAAASAGDDALREVMETLQRWRAEADFRPVFEFYAGILARDGVRRRLLGRLGHEAAEIIDEFLNFCLAEEKAGHPGLEAFLATLDAAGLEIKREMGQGRDEVRIMTVHASKGLEAPVVFLVDGGGAPFSASHLPRLLALELERHPWRGKGFLWRASAELANTASRRIEEGYRERAEEEYRRLLYVGMTRAEDRLIVCGYHGARGQREGTWHDMVEGALAEAPECVERIDEIGGEAVRRFAVVAGGAVDDRQVPLPVAPEDPALPDWFARPAPTPPALPRPLSPSGVSVVIDDEAMERQPSAASPVLGPGDAPASLAIARGVAVHRLLQMLPTLAVEAREAAARRFLDRAGGDWPDAMRAGVLRSVFAVLADAAFAPVFSEEARTEVSVMGTLPIGGRPRLVSAKLDRLHVVGGRVRIVDYKTGAAPGDESAIAPSYLAQMALYRELMRSVYPGLPVETALLYTEGPRLFVLDDHVLDLALAGLAGA